VYRMAQFLGVSKAGYYKSRERDPASSRMESDDALRDRVKDIHTKSRRCYGIDRIQDELIKEGIRVHRRRISRVMKSEGIQGKSRVRKARTTNSDHDLPISPNLLQRDFFAACMNRVWVSDITYIWTREGWLYLCVILDLYSRRVVGWSKSDSLQSSFVIEALGNAILYRRPEHGLIFHSDRGVQYASKAFRDELALNGMVQSMSGKGQCLDNAVAESFFGTLKGELDATHFWSRAEASRELFDYIEGFYNRVRSHSYLGYVSPDEFEKMNQVA